MGHNVIAKGAVRRAWPFSCFIGKCIDYDFDLTYVWFKECGFLGEFNRGTLMYRKRSVLAERANLLP